LKRRTGVALVAVLAMAHCAIGYAAEKDDLREVRERLERLRKDLSKNEDARGRAADQLRASETAISDANRKLRELRLAAQNATSDLKRVGADIERLRGEIEVGQDSLAGLIRGRYVSGGNQTPLKLLLSGQEQGDTARMLTYQAYVSRAQANFIRGLHEDVARMASLEENAQTRRAELAELEAQQQSERETLAAQAAERRTLLASISKEVTSQRKELAAARRNEARLARVVDELTKALRAKAQAQAQAQAREQAKPKKSAPTAGVARNEHVPEAPLRASEFPSLKGRLRLPVRGELANRFGTPRQDSGLTTKGVFIRAHEGDEVRVVANGEVVYADWMRGFGNLLIVDHGAGYMTIYGNNEAVLKRPGDAVRAGDVVATVGATGGNEAPGLYFEMRHLGQPFDPLSWVSLK
jgi:septal ring factor EnvC (AmiA/AmiB activator)